MVTPSNPKPDGEREAATSIQRPSSDQPGVFVVATTGDGAAARIVIGWDKMLCEVYAAIWGDEPMPARSSLPDNDEWAEFYDMLYDEDNWESNFDIHPYYFFEQKFEDGSVRVQRITLPGAAPSATAAGGVAELLTILKAAHEEKMKLLGECRDEAERWKAEGDMYGWNFHQGRAAGANEIDFAYYRAQRRAEAMLAAAPPPPGQPAACAGNHVHNWKQSPNKHLAGSREICECGAERFPPPSGTFT